MSDDVALDLERQARIGLSESIYCAGKTPQQIAAALTGARDAGTTMLLTRLDTAGYGALAADWCAAIDYDPASRTGIYGAWTQPAGPARVAVVTAGTTDLPVAREAARTLAYHGQASREIADVGVAGLWRILEHAEALGAFPVVIVVAGMDGALFSVVGGLVGGVVIAVPTSVGYGAAHGGQTALNSALVSCAPGVVTVNIDNGYGAACAAIRVLRATGGPHSSTTPDLIRG